MNDTHISEPISPEDSLRASYYSLLARLFIAPMDEPTMTQLAQYAPALGSLGAEQVDAMDPLGRALHQAMLALCTAAQMQSLAATQAEFAQLFAAPGNTLDLTAAGYKSTLLQPLRQWLHDSEVNIDTDALGAAEDHISVLAQTMVFLITQSDLSASERADEQADFFVRFVGNWHEQLWTAIAHHLNTPFYQAAARFAQAFLAVEQAAFREMF
jgi:TorA maturation chaperone TorD